MSAAIRAMPTELDIINEDPSVIDRKLSRSPEPIDTRVRTELAQVPGQICQSPGITSPVSRAGTGDGRSPTADFDDGLRRLDSGGSRRHCSKRNTGEASPTFHAPHRQSTKITNASLSFEETEAWDKKAILALGRATSFVTLIRETHLSSCIDGGGIRGYSTLLIIKALMERIAKLESAHSDPAQTSFHPLSPLAGLTPSNSSADSDQTRTEPSQWLPCHYFDYMAGTSTGG